MLLVTRKNLFSEPTRLAISVGGVAVSVLLITFLLALFRGWNEKVGGFVENVDADIWIAREGTTDFLAAGSILPAEPPEELSTLPAVERWSPLIVRPMTATKGATKDGTEMDVQLVGYDTQSGMGGPVRMEEGKGVPGPGEVVVDEALSHRYGVGIGDTIRAGGQLWRVVGKSSGGDFVASQTIFVALDQAQEALEMEGSQWEQVVQDIERADPRVLAITSDDFAAATRDRVLSDVIPILMVILILAFTVGLVVAALTIIPVQGSVRAKPSNGVPGVPDRCGADRCGRTPHAGGGAPVRGLHTLAGCAGRSWLHPAHGADRRLRSDAPSRGHRPCCSVQGVVQCRIAAWCSKCKP